MSADVPLANRRCEACEGGTAPLADDVVEFLLTEVPAWRRDGNWIVRDIPCKNFQEALDRTQAIGAIAEAEGHHPDLRIHAYKHLEVRLSTHAIGGLSENDFILAAKIDQEIPA